MDEHPFKAIVSPEALGEVVRIATWWRRNRPSAPSMFRNELDEALVLIAECPEIGPRVRGRRGGDARVVTLRRSGYRVFYQVLTLPREVFVVHVRHGRRRPLRLV
jgi:plasmid stabilization system protein ParE